jgi:DNA-binding winged helix-turn-helix (wHTH) protein/Tol biopolymer transport system component
VQTQATDSVVSFGTYQADLQNGELRKNGIRLRLQGQPFQVLSLLLKRPGQVVTREELRRSVWPMDTFVDFDHALNTAVKKVRSVLGDDADNPRFVETVPRRGYRFIAPVNSNGTPVELPPRSMPEKSAAPGWFAALGVLAVLMAGLGLAWKAPWRRAGQNPSPDFQRLTFDLPELGDARFMPDGSSLVYSAGWHSHKVEIYAQRLGSPSTQSLGIADAALLAVSHDGELAVLNVDNKAPLGITYRKPAGVLGRTFAGGATRPVVSGVEAADWSPDGQLAVVRRVGNKSRLEFPVGKVLYETIGWMASPRFSPRGDSIAFLDHPMAPDDRGSVVLIDLQGKKRMLSGFWESERGLAWGPRGDEVWFAATRSGVSRALYAVNRTGQERRVLSVAGGLSLQDISRDGAVLLTRDNERLGILFLGPEEKEPRELSWKDWSLVTDITPDGKQILFGEEGENSGTSYQVGLRRTDGSPPVILGSGNAQSLSPDGKWALSILPPPNDQIVLLPTGAGTPRPLERGPIERYQFARANWSPDARQIVFVGYEAGHGPRCYVQSVDAGKPRPFTADGTVFCTFSPDGRILGVTEDRRGQLYRSPESATPEKEFQFHPGETPGAWTPDSKFVYLIDTAGAGVTVSRLELASGRRQFWKEIPAPPTNGEMNSEEVILTPDGQSFAFTYSRHLSDLYLVQGLR